MLFGLLSNKYVTGLIGLSIYIDKPIKPVLFY